MCIYPKCLQKFFLGGGSMIGFYVHFLIDFHV